MKFVLFMMLTFAPTAFLFGQVGYGGLVGFEDGASDNGKTIISELSKNDLTADDGSETPELQILAKKLCSDWNSERKAIATAHLKFRLISAKAASLPRKEFVKLLSSVDLVSHPDDLQQISKRILPPLRPGETRHGDWSNKELWQEGLRIREDYHDPGTDATRLKLQDVIIHYDSRQTQATLLPVGSTITVNQVDTFRFVPQLKPEDLDSIKTSDGQVLINTNGGHRNMIIDPVTGMVLNMRVVDSNGEITSEVIQRGAHTYPGGIVFPKLYIKAGYRNGNLYSVLLCLVMEAVFNEDVSETKFTLSVPSGTLIVDQRPAVPIIQRMQSDTKDVLNYSKF